MLCAAVNNRDSFDRLRAFKNEIEVESPNAAIMLVATKTDLRDGETACLTYEEFAHKKDELGFQVFCETSAKNWQDENVKNVFNRAIKLAYDIYSEGAD